MKKEKTLSFKWFKAYKYAILTAVSVILGLYLFSALSSKNPWLSLPLVLGYAFMLMKQWYPSFRNVLSGFRRISYTDEHLYVEEDGQDVEVPLERVKNVQLVSLDGVYKFEFYDEDPLGKAIYCKPSIWYPFNFPRVDEELDQIRDYIKKRKSLRVPEERFLASQNN